MPVEDADRYDSPDCALVVVREGPSLVLRILRMPENFKRELVGLELEVEFVLVLVLVLVLVILG